MIAAGSCHDRLLQRFAGTLRLMCSKDLRAVLVRRIIFAPIWTVLYALLGVASYQVSSPTGCIVGRVRTAVYTHTVRSRDSPARS